jgi:hypothetical protein
MFVTNRHFLVLKSRTPVALRSDASAALVSSQTFLMALSSSVESSPSLTSVRANLMLVKN